MSARLGLGLTVGASIVALALFHGGYAPTPWGWGSVAGFWISILTLSLRRHVIVNRPAVAWGGVVCAFAGWTALSATWSLSVPRTMLEVERDLLYVGAIATLLLVARHGSELPLIAGVAVGLAAVVLGSFTQYVVGSPHVDITQGYLLFRPIGYANALGGLIAIGIPLFLGFAVADTRRVVQEGAAAMCVVSTAALYLTQNRSGWIALSVALVVWLLRTSARLEVATTILLTAIPAAAAVAVLRHLDLLDTNAGGTSRPDRVLLAAGAVAGLAAVAAVGIRARPHVRVGPRAVASGILVGALGAAASLALAVAHVGDRGHYWRVAWRETERQWLLGAGAGTFEELWFQYRDVTRVVRDAHNLYLETLSELGVVGLLLLMLLLLSPLVVARSSRDSLIAAVRGGYCGFLVHAAFEWDWEMPVVTVSALTLGVALLLSRPEAPPFQLRRPARIAAAVVLGVLALFAVDALAGNSYLVTAERRSRAGDPGAETRAVRATHLIPWASEPWLVIADSRARRGDLAGSREALLAAISRDDHDWAVWYRLAVASQAATRARAIEQAVTLNPRLVRGP